jgi:hypothetical protein
MNYDFKPKRFEIYENLNSSALKNNSISLNPLPKINKT